MSEHYHVQRRTNPASGNIADLKPYDIRENFDKILSNRTIVRRVVRGPIAGGQDIIAESTALSEVSVDWVSDNYDGSAPYTVTVDYTIVLFGSDVVVDWSPGGAEPSSADVYWVSFTYTPIFSASGIDLPDETSFTLNVSEGFSPEKVRHDELSAYITPKDDDGTPMFTKLVFQPNNVDSIDDNWRCMHTMIENLATGEIKNLIPKCLTHRVFGDPTTGTPTNYATYTYERDANGKWFGTLDYRDDGANSMPTFKFDIDAEASGAMALPGPTYGIGVDPDGYFGYYAYLPGNIRSATVIMVGGAIGKIRVSNGNELRTLGDATVPRTITCENEFLCENLIYIEYYNDTGASQVVTDISFTVEWYPSTQLPKLVDGPQDIQFHLTDTSAGAAPAPNLTCDYEVVAEVASYRTKHEERFEKALSVYQAIQEPITHNPQFPNAELGGRVEARGKPVRRVNTDGLVSKGIFEASAYGDGKTDVEIQAAIDAATTAGGGTVKLSGGTWTISADIDIYTNVILDLNGAEIDGQGTQKISISSDKAKVCNGTLTECTIDADNVSDIIIEHCKFEGSTFAGHIIDIDQYNRVYILDNSFQHEADLYAVVLQASSGDCEDGIIRGNLVDCGGTLGKGFRVNGNGFTCYHTIVEGNTVHDARITMRFEECTNYVCTGNTFHCENYEAIYVKDSYRGQVSNNTIVMGAGGGSSALLFDAVGHNCDDLTVANNNINCASQRNYGIRLSSTSYVWRNVTITGNNIQLASSQAIRVEDANDCLITANVCRDPTSTGIYVNDCGGVTINGNDVTAAGSNAIHVIGSSLCTVNNNTVYMAGDRGIYLDTSQYFTVSGNWVRCSGTNIPINVYHTDSSNHHAGVISNNVVRGAGPSDAGIKVNMGSTGNYTDLVVSSNKIYNCTDGIYLISVQGCTVTANDIYYAGVSSSHGIRLDQVYGAVLSSNRVQNNGMPIYAEESDDLTIVGNELKDPYTTDPAIKLELVTFTRVKVADNNIEMASGGTHAIYVTTTTGDSVGLNITGNVIWSDGNYSGGIRVTTAGTGIYNGTISGNTIFRAELGIYTSCNHCTIANNSIFDGADTGIIVRGDYTAVTGNDVYISATGKDGIQIDAAQCTVTGNTILGASNVVIAAGISSFGNSGNVFSGNSIRTFYYGIIISGEEQFVASGNNFYNTDVAIYIYESDYINLNGNMARNGNIGICIASGGSANTRFAIVGNQTYSVNNGLYVVTAQFNDNAVVGNIFGGTTGIDCNNAAGSNDNLMMVNLYDGTPGWPVGHENGDGTYHNEQM